MILYNTEHPLVDQKTCQRMVLLMIPIQHFEAMPRSTQACCKHTVDENGLSVALIRACKATVRLAQLGKHTNALQLQIHRKYCFDQFKHHPCYAELLLPQCRKVQCPVVRLNLKSGKQPFLCILLPFHKVDMSMYAYTQPLVQQELYLGGGLFFIFAYSSQCTVRLTDTGTAVPNLRVVVLQYLSCFTNKKKRKSDDFREGVWGGGRFDLSNYPPACATAHSILSKQNGSTQLKGC